MSFDDMSFEDLDLGARLELAREQLRAVAEQLGGAWVVKDEDGPAELDDAVEGDVRSLVLRARAASGRTLVVSARLQHDDLDQVESEVSLRVELDNRMGTIELRHLQADEERREWMAAVTESLHVNAGNDDERALMMKRLARLPGLTERAEQLMASHDLYGLAIGRSALEVTVAYLDVDRESRDETAEAIGRLPALVAGLEGLASMIETLPSEGHVTCQYCGARVVTGPAGCTRCGAALA